MMSCLRLFLFLWNIKSRNKSKYGSLFYRVGGKRFVKWTAKSFKIWSIISTVSTCAPWFSFLLPPTAYPARTALLVTVFLCQVYLIYRLPYWILPEQCRSSSPINILISHLYWAYSTALYAQYNFSAISMQLCKNLETWNHILQSMIILRDYIFVVV